MSFEFFFLFLRIGFEAFLVIIVIEMNTFNVNCMKFVYDEIV